MTSRDLPAELEAMGRGIQAAWNAADRRGDAMVDIATRALERAHFLDEWDLFDAVTWVGSTPRLARQEDLGARFGQPPVTLYRGEGFFIAALHWLDTPTTTHQHAFSGAFRVLHGNSLHSTYDFRLIEQLDAHCKRGELSWRKSELLEVGAVRPIVAGEAFIHSLCHLARPLLHAALQQRGRTTSASGLNAAYTANRSAWPARFRLPRASGCGFAVGLPGVCTAHSPR